MIDNPATPNEKWCADNPCAGTSFAPWRLYNIGNSKPVQLRDFISAIEAALGKKAEIEMLPLQPGDVPDTFADVSELASQFDYSPSTEIEHESTYKMV